MTHEQQPTEPPEEPEMLGTGTNTADEITGWDPDEQVGDFYEVTIQPGHAPVARKVDPGEVPEPESSPGTETVPAVAAERESAPAMAPELYIASLADYIAGLLHGTWVDARMEMEDIHLAIAQMLETSPELQAQGETDGDWAIHDYQGFGVAKIHEFDDLEMLRELAVGIQEHGAAYSGWADVNEGDQERWALFSEAFVGEYDDLQAYGQQIADDMEWQKQIDAAIGPEVARYAQLDAEALAQDIWMNGEIQIVHKPDGGVWIFRGDV